MGLYRKLYGDKIEPLIQASLLARGQVHGSEVRDMFIDYAQGRFAVDDHAERLLTELVEEGVLSAIETPSPTISQAAFIGLQYDKKSYLAAGWAPGLREHFWYQANRCSVAPCS